MKIRILIAVLLVSSASCKKPKTYPAEPEIKFKELATYPDGQGIDTAADLTISFTDGDGDIGLSQADSAMPDNFYIDFFVKRNGVFEQYPFLIPGQRIPYINHEGKDQSLTGDIIMHLNFTSIFIFIPPLDKDTLRCDAYIYDRALHRSNTISTPEIILTTQ